MPDALKGLSQTSIGVKAPCWFVYWLYCDNDSIYTGITTDPMRRWQQHCSKKGARYTKSHRPLAMKIVFRGCAGRVARRWEYQLKQWPSQRKRQLWRQLRCEQVA